MSEREHHIKVLENLLSHYKAREKCEGYYDNTLKDNVEALAYAIASIKTDLKYDLLYEETSEQADKQADKPTTKNDLVVDLIPRADVLKLMQDNWHTHNGDWAMQESMDDIRALPAVTPQEPKIGHCKNCKFFELNSWAACGGIPIIVAHEICKAWGEGCKTKEDGYCFLFEPKESEG